MGTIRAALLPASLPVRYRRCMTIHVNPRAAGLRKIRTDRSKESLIEGDDRHGWTEWRQKADHRQPGPNNFAPVGGNRFGKDGCPGGLHHPPLSGPIPLILRNYTGRHLYQRPPKAGNARLSASGTALMKTPSGNERIPAMEQLAAQPPSAQISTLRSFLRQYHPANHFYTIDPGSGFLLPVKRIEPLAPPGHWKTSSCPL